MATPSWSTYSGSLNYSVSSSSHSVTTKTFSAGGNASFSCANDLKYFTNTSYGTSIIVVQYDNTNGERTQSDCKVGIGYPANVAYTYSLENFDTNNDNIYSFSDNSTAVSKYIAVGSLGYGYKVFGIHNNSASSTPFAAPCADGTVYAVSGSLRIYPDLYYSVTSTAGFNTWVHMKVSNVDFYSFTTRSNNILYSKQISVSKGKKYAFTIHTYSEEGCDGVILSESAISSVSEFDSAGFYRLSGDTVGAYTYTPTSDKTIYMYFRTDGSSLGYDGEGYSSADVKISSATTTTVISFNKNGGSGGLSGTNRGYGSTASISSVPTRSPYTFLGYFDSISGGTKYFNADGTSARAWDKVETTYTLYARWENTITSLTNSGTTLNCYTTSSASVKTSTDSTKTIDVKSSIYGTCASGSQPLTYNSVSMPTGFSINSYGIISITSGVNAGNYNCYIYISSPSLSGSNGYVGISKDTYTVPVKINVPSENSSHYKDSACTTYGNNITTYAAPSVSIGSGMTASGGSAAVTCSAINLGNWYQKWTNGASKYHSGNISGTAVWRITSNGNNRFNNPSSGGMNIKINGNVNIVVWSSGTSVSHSSMEAYETTDTVVVNAYNYNDTSKTSTTSKSVSNEMLPDRYNDSGAVGISSQVYGTPSVSIGSGMTASGGSAAVTCSGYDTFTWHRKYTSGSLSNLITRNVPSAVIWSITANGNNRFSIPGQTLQYYMYIDDFWETDNWEDQGYSSLDEYLNDQDMLSDPESTDLYTNKYGYYGNTFSYGGNTYYLWQLSPDVEDKSSALKYIVTDSVNYQTLQQSSLEFDQENWRFGGGHIIYRLNNDQSIYDEAENQCIVLIRMNKYSSYYGDDVSINHSNMTTNKTTDSVTVTAFNYYDGSKKATASNSISNTITNLSIICADSFIYDTTTSVTVKATYTSGSVENDVTSALTVKTSDTGGDNIIWPGSSTILSIS